MYSSQKSLRTINENELTFEQEGNVTFENKQIKKKHMTSKKKEDIVLPSAPDQKSGNKYVFHQGVFGKKEYRDIIIRLGELEKNTFQMNKELKGYQIPKIKSDVDTLKEQISKKVDILDLKKLQSVVDEISILNR